MPAYKPKATKAIMKSRGSRKKDRGVRFKFNHLAASVQRKARATARKEAAAGATNA